MSVNPYNINMAPTVNRVFAALPAAGAYDTPVESFIIGSVQATICGEYTEGVAGGSVRLNAEVSPYGDDVAAPALSWFPVTAYGQVAVVAGNLTASLLEPEVWTFDPVTVAREGFILTFDIPASMARVRVAVAELGQVGTPGSCGLIMLISER